MKTVLKSELLSELRQKNDRHLKDAIGIFQNLREEELLQPALNGGWSIAQCLEHLNTYGDFYLPLLRKAVARAEVPHKPYYKSGWLGDYFTKAMDPATGTKKMKAFKSHTPGTGQDAYKVVATFIQQLEDLHSYLDKAQQSDLDQRLPISISSIIRLKTGDVFRFLIAHNERHMLQARRNLLR